ncbi:MAG: hypothetical protein LBE50_03310 [Gallionellaceae bacterium]|jgi:hypothetical protein|nr:hypothetical protein [Gallionellaceae bacterium]
MSASSEQLNHDPRAGAFNLAALGAALRARGAALHQRVVEQCPHLYAVVPVFLARAQVEQMRAVVAAVMRVVALPGWGAGVAQPQTYAPQAGGVFFGYDFHVNADGIHLIEINTNAGGAFLNALLAQSQRDANLPGGATGADDMEAVYLEMFREEWRMQRGDAPLTSVAIVDENPQAQFLYPEFELARQMFARAGLHAVILDPSELETRADGLYHDGRKIDLIYNRLTDFSLEQHPALATAYANDRVVLTPHPFVYATYADKRNLIRLTDADALRALGADAADIDILQRCVPQTRLVRAEDVERWRAERKQWFFKPVTGFGSRGTYRGENVTQRVFAEIMQAEYVAQRLAPPDTRTIAVDGVDVTLKSDVRCYVYQGEIQVVGAGLYQGQTHNTRTPGGGFTLVRVV